MEKVPTSAKSLLPVDRNKFRNCVQAGRKISTASRNTVEAPLMRFCKRTSLNAPAGFCVPPLKLGQGEHSSLQGWNLAPLHRPVWLICCCFRKLWFMFGLSLNKSKRKGKRKVLFFKPRFVREVPSCAHF